MRIYILDPDGEAIDYSAERLPARWREAVLDIAQTTHGIHGLTLGQIGEHLLGPVQDEDNEVVRAYVKWRRGNPYVIDEGERVPALDFIKRSCISAWLFNPEILKAFDRRSYMTDGYAKILADGLEHGWLLHDGLNRMIP